MAHHLNVPACFDDNLMHHNDHTPSLWVLAEYRALPMLLSLTGVHEKRQQLGADTVRGVCLCSHAYITRLPRFGAST